ncbi:MAG: hypothetical protein M3017_00455 [Actinomycetota bacterium]|nr:hypothetical protein [Actinomycetota bacterium]
MHPVRGGTGVLGILLRHRPEFIADGPQSLGHLLLLGSSLVPETVSEIADEVLRLRANFLDDVLGLVFGHRGDMLPRINCCAADFLRLISGGFCC